MINKILAIGNTFDYLSYAFFDNSNLVEYKNIFFDSVYHQYQLLLYANEVESLIKKYEPLYIIVEKNNKLVARNTILQYLCAKYGVVYVETTDIKFYNKFFFVSKKKKELQQEKISFINEVFGINLKYNKDNLLEQGEVLAETIFLGSYYSQDSNKKREVS